MRRAAPALAATVAGVVLVLRFQTARTVSDGALSSGPDPTEASTAPTSTVAPTPETTPEAAAAPTVTATSGVAPTAAPGAATTPAPNGASPPSSSSSPAGRATSTTTRAPDSTPSSTVKASSTTVVTTTTTTTSVRTVDGPVIETVFGPVQVKVTLEGRRLVDVVALQLPSRLARSREISEFAAPILRREALAAQSAAIVSVSGASITSEAYAGSLQAALDLG